MHEALYDRGIAVGHSDITKDVIVFRFRDETFEVPTFKVYPIVEWTGYSYWCPIDKLRELEREAIAP